MRVEFFAESKLILIWGSNSITSNLHFWRYAQVAKRNGAKLVCIDPRKSETADKCHEHIALLPGTDAALALAMMHELIATTGWTTTTSPNYTLGWDALRARALQWPPNARRRCVALPSSRSPLARDYGECAARRARRHPDELRHAARARRRQCGARHCLPARADRCLAAPRGWRAVVQLGQFSGVSAPPCSAPTCWPGARRAPSTW
jgi:hypothetical protein